MFGRRGGAAGRNECAMSYSPEPELGEIVHYKAPLKKLTKSTGAKLGDASFKPFAIFENPPKREIYLVHKNSNNEPKRNRLLETCTVARVPDGHKDFSRLEFTIQITFAPGKAPQVYQSQPEDYELWFQWLHYVIHKSDVTPWIPVTVPNRPSSLVEPYLKVTGPTLMKVKEGVIMLFEPSLITSMRNCFKLDKLTCFGTGRRQVWFKLCYVCAKKLQGDRATPETNFRFDVESDSIGTLFIARMKEESRTSTTQLSSTTSRRHQGDEQFVLDHIRICGGATLCLIRLDRDYLERSISPLFLKSWQHLAKAAKFESSEIRMLESTGPKAAFEFLNKWRTTSSQDDSSEPRRLLELTERAGLTSEAMELQYLFLDPCYANTMPRAESNASSRQTGPEETHESLEQYGRATLLPTTRTAERQEKSSTLGRPLPSTPDVAPKVPATMPPADIPLDTPVRQRPTSVAPDPKHPLSANRLTALAFKVEETNRDKWEWLALHLLDEGSVESIKQENPQSSDGGKLGLCFKLWKRESPDATVHVLTKALEDCGFTALAKSYRDDCGDPAYSVSDLTAKMPESSQEATSTLPGEDDTKTHEYFVPAGQSPKVPRHHKSGASSSDPVADSRGSEPEPPIRFSSNMPSPPVPRRNGSQRPPVCVSPLSSPPSQPVSPLDEPSPPLRLPEETPSPMNSPTVPVRRGGAQRHSSPAAPRRSGATPTPRARQSIAGVPLPATSPTSEVAGSVTLPRNALSAYQSPQPQTTNARPPAERGPQSRPHYDCPIAPAQRAPAGRGEGGRAHTMPHQLSGTGESSFRPVSTAEADVSSPPTTDYMNIPSSVPRVQSLMDDDDDDGGGNRDGDPSRSMPVARPRSSRTNSVPSELADGYVNMDATVRREYVQPANEDELNPYTTFHKYPTKQ